MHYWLIAPITWEYSCIFRLFFENLENFRDFWEFLKKFIWESVNFQYKQQFECTLCIGRLSVVSVNECYTGTYQPRAAALTRYDLFAHVLCVFVLNHPTAVFSLCVNSEMAFLSFVFVVFINYISRSELRKSQQNSRVNWFWWSPNILLHLSLLDFGVKFRCIFLFQWNILMF